MKFPNWAPLDLIEYYEGFPDDIDELGVEFKQMIFRLLTRPEMEKVWGWQKSLEATLPVTANGGMVGSFLNSYEDYVNFVKVPNSERQEDFLEIKELANRLAIKLHKYEKEKLLLFNSYLKLIPKEFDEKLIKELRVEYKNHLSERKLKQSWIRDFPYWDFYLPKISALVKNIAINAGDEDPKFHRLPTKITQKSSLKTFLISEFITKNSLYSLTHPPHIITATFVSVALDDPNISADDVRKVYKGWKIKYDN